MKFDWKAIIRDKVPCYFWDPTTTEELPISRLIDITAEGRYISKHKEDGIISRVGYQFCKPIRSEDTKKYTIREPEYRPCETLKEFEPFWDKRAKHKVTDYYIRLDTVDFTGNNCASMTPRNLFKDFKLLDGSIIGVKMRGE